MNRGDYVRIGKGLKVYQVVDVTYSWPHSAEQPAYKLAATADHPDAAVREQDAFEWYPEARLALVRRR